MAQNAEVFLKGEKLKAKKKGSFAPCYPGLKPGMLSANSSGRADAVSGNHPSVLIECINIAVDVYND